MVIRAMTLLLVDRAEARGIIEYSRALLSYGPKQHKAFARAARGIAASKPKKKMWGLTLDPTTPFT